MVHGYGAAVQLLFGGKEPGTPLMFEYTEASLIQCHSKCDVNPCSLAVMKCHVSMKLDTICYCKGVALL